MKTLADISEAMKDIDFCMLVSRAEDGSIGGRPMSNNREVEYEGTSRFFTFDDTRMVRDITRDASVGLTYQGKAGLLGVVGKPGLFVHVDITDEQSVLDGFAKARAAHGQERIPVHCALTSRRGKTLAYDKETGTFRRTPTADYEYGVAGILTASYRIGSIAAEGMATLPELEDGERGAIIFTASVAAQDAQIGQVIYGSAKAGVNGLVLPMARDLMDLGIRVNSIMPGVFGTPLLGNMNPKVKESLEASVPFPRGVRTASMI